MACHGGWWNNLSSESRALTIAQWNPHETTSVQFSLPVLFLWTVGLKLG